jgi:very-short-patch-repair endonuclease
MRVFGSTTERIEQIARVQLGRISRAQLIAAGLSRDAIARRVAAGYLIRLHRCVFAVGHLAPTSLGAETAALLASCDGAVLSHHTAAEMWRIRRPNAGDGPIHITVPGDKGVRVAGAKVHRTRLLEPQDTRIHHRLPVTSPARTLFDIAPALTLRELERALDEALIAKLVSPTQIAAFLDRTPRRPGAPRLKALLDRSATTRTRSEAEERFLALVRAAELPVPEVNAQLQGYEIDFLWRERRLAVEIDGYAFHGGRPAFERDRRKDARLQATGFTTMRVTWLQLRHEPYAVVGRIAQALASS